MSEIPANHQEFCKEVAKLCRKHGLSQFQGTYRAGYADPWRSSISFGWDAGRHEADVDKVSIWSELRVNTQVDAARE